VSDISWTSPATAVTGSVITASFWNVNGRDNLLVLGGSTGKVDASATVKNVQGEVILLQLLGL